MDRAYTVTGIWPFPLDMLRHDQARAATNTDQALIDRMSGEASDDVIGLTSISIQLLMEAGEPTRGRPQGRLVPNAKRWESFGWTVNGAPEIEQEQQAETVNRDCFHYAMLHCTARILAQRQFGCDDLLIVAARELYDRAQPTSQEALDTVKRILEIDQEVTNPVAVMMRATSS